MGFNFDERKVEIGLVIPPTKSPRSKTTPDKVNIGELYDTKVALVLYLAFPKKCFDVAENY